MKANTKNQKKAPTVRFTLELDPQVARACDEALGQFGRTVTSRNTFINFILAFYLETPNAAEFQKLLEKLNAKPELQTGC